MRSLFLKRENARIRRNTILFDASHPEETKYFNWVARENARRRAWKEEHIHPRENFRT